MFKNKEKTDNWQYSVCYDLDSESDCEVYGCDKEGICRCRRIVGISVGSDLNGIDTFFSHTYEETGDSLDKVLAHWFCRKNFHKICWDFETTGGYYGEELEKITVSEDHGFFNLAEAFEKMSHKEKIEFLLQQEYGFVLPKVLAVKDWQLKAVFLSDVVNATNTNLSTHALAAYKNFCEMKVRIKDLRENFQENTRILAPLTLTADDKKYQVIDGRHRVTALTEEYEWKEYMPSPKKGQGAKLHKGVFAPVYVWVICPKEEQKKNG